MRQITSTPLEVIGRELTFSFESGMTSSGNT